MDTRKNFEIYRPQKVLPVLVYSISGEKESASRLGLFEVMTLYVPSFT